MHYRRWQRHGDPFHAAFEPTFSPEEALSKKTIRKNNCILWTGHKTPNGYGLMTVNKKDTRVHRYVWEVNNGPIPPDMFIDHICHVRNCCNIDHLRLVTCQQNQSYRRGASKDNVNSGVRNVHQNGNKWQVVVMKNYTKHRFGTYATIEEAAAVAEQARQKLFGEFAGNG